MIDDIFFSGTFAGETLSLAAALATIEKMQRDDVINHVTTLGDTLSKGLQHLIETHNTQSWMSVSGHPSWSFFNIAPQGNYSALQLRSLFIQEMAKRGILINSSHNLSFSHKAHHIDSLLTAYDEVLPILVNAVEQQCLDKYFTGTTLENVFKVR
ncbi:MAG: hypothetical protein AAGJ17_10585 [Pseudomonadota bacterium]